MPPTHLIRRSASTARRGPRIRDIGIRNTLSTRRARTRARRASHLLAYTLRRLLVTALWMLAWAPAFDLPPVPASAAVLLLLLALLWTYVWRGKSRARRHATLRLRGLGRSTPWVLAAVPVWVIYNGALAVLSLGGGRHLDASSAWLATYADQPLGWLPVLLLTVLLAPLLEEICFRGWIQRTMERHLGATAGIVATAALFAGFHFEPARIPFLFAGGLVFGFAVHAARSVWAGVLLHAAANLWPWLLLPWAARVEDLAAHGPSRAGFALALVTALLSAVPLAWLGERVWRSARNRPLRRLRPAADPS